MLIEDKKCFIMSVLLATNSEHVSATEKSPKVCKNGLGRIHHEKMNPSFIVVLEKCTDKL
jgi:hypothetical protein